MESMNYTQSSGYQANTANTQRPCDPSPGHYHQQGGSFPTFRNAYLSHYDPVHDHANHNNHMLSMRNNRVSQDNVFSYGNQYHQNGMPMPVVPSGGQMGSYTQYSSYSPMVDVQQRNNAFQSQYSSVQYPSAHYGGMSSDPSVSMPPHFGSPTRLPITNTMSRHQARQEMMRQMEQEHSNLRAHIQAQTAAQLQALNALRGNDPAIRSYSGNASGSSPSRSTYHTRSGSRASLNLTNHHNASPQRERRGGISSMPLSPTRPRASRHGSGGSDASASGEDDNQNSAFVFPSASRAEVLALMQAYAASPVKPKISQAALDSLVIVSKEELEAEGEEPQCIICYNDFGVKNPEGVTEQPLRLPKCRHVFGDVCIKQWLEENSTCPYCRDKLPVETVDPRTRALESVMAAHATSYHSQSYRRAQDRAENIDNRQTQRDGQRQNRTGGSAASISERNTYRVFNHGFPPDFQHSAPGLDESGPYTAVRFRGTVEQSNDIADAGQPERSEVSPAIAVGSGSDSSRADFMSRAHNSRRYSGQGFDRYARARNAHQRHSGIERGNLSPDTGFTNNASFDSIFGPSERQLALGSPTPAARQTSEDFSDYQTHAPWRDD